MPPVFSIYLEAIRVIAAMVVVLGHLSGARLLGGTFWQFGPFMGDAVMVFFVLSGFVIAHSASASHQTGHDYAAARIARIASVALPALLVTFVLDRVGIAVAPEAYSASWGFEALSAWQYIGSAVFLSRIWWLDGSVGSMLPYWSLHNEVWYYLLFGLAHYAPARQRLLWVAGAALVAGPPILALMPVWLFGVAAQRIVAGGGVSRPLGLLLAILPPLLWVAFLVVFGRPTIPHGWLLRAELVQDYVVGLAFALHLVGMAALLRGVPLTWPRLSAALRWLAGGTFTLYLLHLPVAQFVASVSPLPPVHPVQRLLLIALTIGVPYLVAEVTERRKRFWRGLVERALGRPPVGAALPGRP